MVDKVKNLIYYTYVSRTVASCHFWQGEESPNANLARDYGQSLTATESKPRFRAAKLRESATENT